MKYEALRLKLQIIKLRAELEGNGNRVPFWRTDNKLTSQNTSVIWMPRLVNKRSLFGLFKK